MSREPFALDAKFRPDEHACKETTKPTPDQTIATLFVDPGAGRRVIAKIQKDWAQGHVHTVNVASKHGCREVDDDHDRLENIDRYVVATASLLFACTLDDLGGKGRGIIQMPPEAQTCAPTAPAFSAGIPGRDKVGVSRDNVTKMCAQWHRGVVQQPP